MKLLISLVIKQRLRCKLASGQMLCIMKSQFRDSFWAQYSGLESDSSDVESVQCSS